MSLLRELQRDNIRPVFKLEIAGVKEIYYSGDTAPSVGLTRTAVPGIVGVSAIRAKLDLLEAFSDSGSVQVRIKNTRTNGARDRLMRLGPKGATRRATLKTSLAQTILAGTVEVNEDISAWPATGVLWIGREAIAYSARTVVAPFQFTVPASPNGRGYYGSEVQGHVVDAARGWVPRVYSEPVRFRGRWAKLWIGVQRPDGSLSDDWIQELNGFVQVDPEMGPDGVITVRLVDPTSVFGRKIGGANAQTTLQEGWHVFDGVAGNTMWMVQRWDQGAAWRGVAQGAIAGGNTLTTINYSAHQDVFDPTLGVGEPRHGSIVEEQGTHGAYLEPDPAGAYAGAPESGTINLVGASLPHAGFNGSQWFANASASETYYDTMVTPGTPTAVRWPEGGIETWNAAFNPGTNAGASGQWADVRIEPHVRFADGSAGPALTCRLNSSEHRRPLKLEINQGTGARDWYFGIDMADPEDEVVLRWVRDRESAQGGYFWPLGGHPRTIELRSTSNTGEEGRDVIPIRRIARAFWAYDQWIHVEEDVFGSPSAGRPLEVLVEVTEFGEDHRFVFQVVDKVLADSLFPGVPGWLLEVDEQQRSRAPAFGNFPGEPRCRLQQLMSWKQTPPWRVVLELLLSGDGDFFNHLTYDRLPGGLNLTEDQVDVASFESFPSPGGLASRVDDFTVSEELEVSKILQPMLRMSNAVVVPRLNPVTGERKLTMVPVGVATALDSVATLTDGDWQRERRPESRVDYQVRNAAVLKLNYSFVENKHYLTLDVDDLDAIAEDSTRHVLTEDLRGFQVRHDDIPAQRAAVQPVVAEWFALVGYPRRTLRGSISYRDALVLDVGAVVIVSASHVVGYDGSEGVVAMPMRVVELSRDPWRQSAEVELVYHQANTAGWAPAMEVDVIVSATEVDVLPNAFTAATHPITGEAQQDVDYFFASDICRAVPEGDYSTSTGGLQIASIAGLRVTFTANHNLLAAGATIRPDAYGSVSSRLQGYAYFADDAGTLGATPDDGKDFA